MLLLLAMMTSMTVYASHTGLQLLLPLHRPAAPGGQEGRGPQTERECGSMTHKKHNNQKELTVHTPTACCGDVYNSLRLPY